MALSQSHDRTFTGLIPGQTYLLSAINGLMLREAERHGEYEVFSTKNTSQETYMVVPDVSGTLQLRFPGDEVCCACTHGSCLHSSTQWMHSYYLFMQTEDSVISWMCPGFVADSAPPRRLASDDRTLKGGRTAVLQLNDLSMEDGDVWIKTDSKDAFKLGYNINIHVSV